MDVEELDDVAVPVAWSNPKATVIFVGGLLALAVAIFGLGSIVSEDPVCITWFESNSIQANGGTVDLPICPQEPLQVE